MKKVHFTLIALLFIGTACAKPVTNTSQQANNANVGVLQTNTVPSTNTVGDDALVLANLGGVTFQAHNKTDQTAGDIRMAKTYLDAGAGRNVPVFLFGQPLPGRDHVQLNPNLEFGGLVSAVDVVSAIDGIVGFVRQQTESNDYEVFLQPKENSMWTIGYDHLTNVAVKQGDAVTIGQKLGKAARENNGMYRYELQINKDVNGVTTFYCPVDLLRADVRESYATAITQFITEWNAFYGSKVYGTYTSACTKSVLTLSETE